MKDAKQKTDSDLKPETRGRKSQTAYPWDTIAVEGTFYWSEPYSEDESQKCRSLIQYYQDKLDRRFSMRTIEEEGEKKIKVWRDA